MKDAATPGSGSTGVPKHKSAGSRNERPTADTSNITPRKAALPERKMSDNGGVFPLPDGYFPEMQLSAEQVAHYETQMQEIVKNALAAYELHEAKGAYPVYRAPWSLVGSVEQLTTIRKESAEHASVSQARIFGRINGHYRNFIDFFYAETSSQLFAWNQFMFGYAVDAAVLKNIHTAADKRPGLYMGIKWTCLNPSPLVRKRDNCYLEYLAYTKDLKGRDVGVRVTLPLDLPECPELPEKLKTKRIRLNTVWIARAADREPNATDFFMLSENDFNGLAVTASYYKRMMNILQNMAVFVDSRRILMQGMMTRESWAAPKSRKSCSICSRGFNPTRHRHHCRLCGDLICRRCAIVRDAPKEDDWDQASGAKPSKRTFRIAKTKFCVICVTKMRDSAENALVPIPAPSGRIDQKGSVDMGDIGEDELRMSFTSETDDSDTGKQSLYSETSSSEGMSLQLSPQSNSVSSHPGKMTYVTTLGAIDDDDVLQTAESGDESVGPILEVTEVIDTTDMVPLSQLDSFSKKSGALGSSTEDEHSSFASGKKSSTGSSGGSGWSPLDRLGNASRSPRSIDQCIAEQEELLRRMWQSASAPRRGNTNSTRPGSMNSNSGSSGTKPASSRPEVKLY